MNIESKIKELTEKLNQYAYEYYYREHPVKRIGFSHTGHVYAKPTVSPEPFSYYRANYGI